MSLATNKSDLWWSTLSSLRECADSKKEALFYLARFLKWLEVSLRICLYFILPASISKICIIDIYVKQISTMLTRQQYCATLLRRNKSSIERRSERLPNWGEPFHSFIWIWIVFLFICHGDNICGGHNHDHCSNQRESPIGANPSITHQRAQERRRVKEARELRNQDALTRVESSGQNKLKNHNSQKTPAQFLGWKQRLDQIT